MKVLDVMDTHIKKVDSVHIVCDVSDITQGIYIGSDRLIYDLEAKNYRFVKKREYINNRQKVKVLEIHVDYEDLLKQKYTLEENNYFWVSDRRYKNNEVVADSIIRFTQMNSAFDYALQLWKNYNAKKLDEHIIYIYEGFYGESHEVIDLTKRLLMTFIVD